MRSTQLLFLPVAFVKATIPHSSAGASFIRRNGREFLWLRSMDDGPLPCGIHPRLILTHLTTAAVLSKGHEVRLGRTPTDLLRLIGAGLSGGVEGASTRVREQWRRLQVTEFTYERRGIAPPENHRELKRGGWPYHDNQGRPVEHAPIIDRVAISRSDGFLVLLSHKFFELTRSAVPLDPALVRAAGRSPFRFDLFAWLTYRSATLKRTTIIPWMSLAKQFGSNYRRPRDFRRQVRKTLPALTLAWPDFCVDIQPRGLLVSPPAPSVQAWASQRIHGSDIDQERGRKGWSDRPNAGGLAPIQ